MQLSQRHCLETVKQTKNEAQKEKKAPHLPSSSWPSPVAHEPRRFRDRCERGAGRRRRRRGALLLSWRLAISACLELLHASARRLVVVSAALGKLHPTGEDIARGRSLYGRLMPTDRSPFLTLATTVRCGCLLSSRHSLGLP